MPAKKVPLTQPTSESQPRARLSQEDVPAHTLEEALRVPRSLLESFGRKPTIPQRIAGALDMAPQGSQFQMLTGASIAYGLTVGGYHAAQISLTELGDSILRPKAEGAELLNKRIAFLRPKVIKKFLDHYSGSPIPAENIACHILEDFGVPTAKAPKVFKMIVSEAAKLGLTHTIKGKNYVDLGGVDPESQGSNQFSEPDAIQEDESEPQVSALPTQSGTSEDLAPHKNLPATEALDAARLKKVFITHGKNRDFLEPIKKLLVFGELEAVISVERSSTSLPVPEKIMQDMRGCGGAIIHVVGETFLKNDKDEDVAVLNPNVLIEIGAAMALFGKRFILLVRRGVALPSNLQGLYEVRYDGDSLTGEATIELLSSIMELKKQSLP